MRMTWLKFTFFFQTPFVLHTNIYITGSWCIKRGQKSKEKSEHQRHFIIVHSWSCEFLCGFSWRRVLKSSGDPLTCWSAHVLLQSHLTATHLPSPSLLKSTLANCAIIKFTVILHLGQKSGYGSSYRLHIQAQGRQGTQIKLKAELCASWLKLWHRLENNETLSWYLQVIFLKRVTEKSYAKIWLQTS